MDKFEQHFPNTDPKKVGCVFERLGKDGKSIEKWVKVFKYEEGIEEFSEGLVKRTRKNQHQVLTLMKVAWTREHR